MTYINHLYSLHINRGTVSTVSQRPALRVCVQVGIRMEEDEVIGVVRKYLTDSNSKFYRQKGSGPDFVLEKGGVIEAKGSGFDLKRAAEQIIRYVLTYPKVEIAVPVDALNVAELFTLLLIETSMKASGKSSIKAMLIARVEENKYKIKVYLSIEDLWSYIFSKFEEIMTVAGSSDAEEGIRRNAEIILNMEIKISQILEEDATSVMGQEVILSKNSHR